LNDYVDELKKVGLTEYEAKTYYMLLQKKDFIASDLAKVSGVPRTRIYSVLESLLQKGLCTVKGDAVKRFEAVNPEFAFNNLINDLVVETNNKKKKIVEISDSLKSIFNSERENEAPLEYVRVIRESTRVGQLLQYLENNAKGEIISMSKPPYIANIHEIEERGGLSKKNPEIRYRYLFEYNETTDKDVFKLMEMWDKAGAEIKVLPAVPAKLLIFDEETVMLNIPDKVVARPTFTSIYIENKETCSMFREMFDIYFSQATSYADFKQQLTEREEEK